MIQSRQLRKLNANYMGASRRSAAKSDLNYFILTLDDFKAVTGREMTPNCRVLGPYGSGVVNENSEHMLDLSIYGINLYSAPSR